MRFTNFPENQLTTMQCIFLLVFFVHFAFLFVELLVRQPQGLPDLFLRPCVIRARADDASGLEFYEASAKDNINVTPIFERLVDLICDKMSKSLDANTTVLNNPQTKRLTAQGPGGAGGAAGAGPGGLSSLQQQCQQC